jgi:hypothetical protein
VVRSDFEESATISGISSRVSTHLFDEPCALDEVARLAHEWFVRNLEP